MSDVHKFRFIDIRVVVVRDGKWNRIRAFHQPAVFGTIFDAAAGRGSETTFPNALSA
jgi:hypothetical protein